MRVDRYLTSYRVNTYFALLAITIIASGATLLIVHTATGDHTATALGNEAPYQDLQRSILGK